MLSSTDLERIRANNSNALHGPQHRRHHKTNVFIVLLVRGNVTKENKHGAEIHSQECLLAGTGGYCTLLN